MASEERKAPGIVGVVLAGGQSRRMGGGDKALTAIAGKPMLAHVIERAMPQVEALVINANGDPARFSDFGLPVVPDVVDGFVGPLAGILTGLEWASRYAPGAAYVASFSCDAPFLPYDLVARLVAAREDGGATLACAASGGRDHPVIGLWPVALSAALKRALVDEGVRKIDLWTARYRLARAEFPTEPFDPFFNVNSPDEVAQAERFLRRS